MVGDHYYNQGVMDKYTLLSIIRWGAYETYLESATTLEKELYKSARPVLNKVMRKGDYTNTPEEDILLDDLYAHVYSWAMNRKGAALK